MTVFIFTNDCRKKDFFQLRTSTTILLSLKSSTKTISLSRDGGVVFMTLCMVLKSVEKPSLWKTIITLAVGRFLG